ncbi:hypothetical protein KR032_009057 [Drosophila birchii]|nr:hypothetical protein KR032_009057 [Drosophila birchii]
MSSSAQKVKVFKKGCLEVSDDIILIILAMLRKFKYAGENPPVFQPVIKPMPLLADRVDFRLLKAPNMQKDIVKYEPKPKDFKRSLKKLPLPDKLQYIVLRGRWSPIFKIAMCLNG